MTDVEDAGDIWRWDDDRERLSVGIDLRLEYARVLPDLIPPGLNSLRVV